MDEVNNASSISIQLESELKCSTISFQFKIPVLNPVLKIDLQDDLTSKPDSAKMSTARKVSFSKRPPYQQNVKKSSKHANQSSNYLAINQDEIKTAKISVCCNEVVAKPRNKGAKNVTINKAATRKGKKLNANKVCKPATNKAKRPRLYAKKGFLQKQLKNNFISFDGICIRNILYTQADIPNSIPVSTDNDLTTKCVNLKISMTKNVASPKTIDCHKSTQAVARLVEPEPYSLPVTQTLCQTTNSADTGYINVANITVNLENIPIIRKRVLVKNENSPANVVFQPATNKVKKTPAAKFVKKPRRSSKTGVLKKPWWKTLHLFGDFCNRKTKCVQSETAASNSLQTPMRQEVLTFKVCNPKVVKSKIVSYLQKHHNRKTKKYVSKLEKKPSDYYGTKHNVNKTTKIPASAYKKVDCGNIKRDQSTILKKYRVEKKPFVFKAKRPSENTIQKQEISVRGTNLNVPEMDTLSFLDDVFLKSIFFIFAYYMVKTILSLPVPKQARY